MNSSSAAFLVGKRNFVRFEKREHLLLSLLRKQLKKSLLMKNMKALMFTETSSRRANSIDFRRKLSTEQNSI